MSKFQARQDVKSKMLWIHGGQSAQAALGALGDFWNSNVLSTTVTSSLTSTVMTVSNTHTSTATFTEAWAYAWPCNGKVMKFEVHTPKMDGVFGMFLATQIGSY